MSRCFIALEIPKTTLEKIIAIRDEIYGFDDAIRWEPLDKQHITLKFLGEVDSNIQAEVEKILERVISSAKSLELCFSSFGLFMRNGKPNILWVGLKKSDLLDELFQKLENELFEIGLKKEKRYFKPHLTILRITGNEDIETILKFQNYNISNTKFNSNMVTLFKSKLLPSGSVYEKIKIFELK